MQDRHTDSATSLSRACSSAPIFSQRSTPASMYIVLVIVFRDDRLQLLGLMRVMAGNNG
jgi:hypothetical protein